MTSAPTLSDRIDALCVAVEEQTSDGAARVALAQIRERLREPLRVAIAGRVKAGKSTLLNALVGERLAPTDAGECTRVVTWYKHGLVYDVDGRFDDGRTAPIRFTRDDGALSFELPRDSGNDLEHIEVKWPSSRLQQTTFIDTPGIGSTDDSVAARTSSFFALEQEGPADADAVIYLLRHVHVSDAEFLDAFRDRAIANGSPVNAIGVLSRADEVGAGRLDAIVSARAVASRYGTDTRLRPLVSGCVAVAGLIAETAATLEEAEAASLRRLSELEPETLNDMLVSADRFLDSESSDLTVEIRIALLERLGMFGVRFALRCILDGEATSASELSRALLAVSGITDLRLLLEGQFTARAGLLKARSALAALKGIARSLDETDPSAAEHLRRQMEELEASAHELAELRLLHMLRCGAVVLADEEMAEMAVLLDEEDPSSRLGFETGSDPELSKAHALKAVGRWRERAANPVNDRDVVFACETIARSYEGIYSALT